MPERVLVTSALPYADGPIHFGHVVGAYLPADVYVRLRRQRGDEVLFVCGTDEHGVAVTLHAEQVKEPYQAYVNRWHQVQADTFKRLAVEFDVFSGTSAGANPRHAALSQHFFTRLLENGYVFEKVEEQLWCGTCARFLADRYVEGTCPKCGFDKARGDECPSCGSWLDVNEVKDPRCKLCGAKPLLKATKHWYLDLAKLRDEKIDGWFKGKTWKPNVTRFVEGMLADLRERPVTRDLPWGVPVPLPGAAGKVLYVWFDAPIGYVSITQQHFEAKGDPEGWRRWWLDPATKLVHFIGKDNIAFHCVVFPAMLHGVKEGYVLPEDVPANEFFNLEGRKFNKSTGWYLPLDEFFARYPTDATRYGLLCALPETADSDFLWREFQQRVNSDLADTFGNFVSRTLRFAERYGGGSIADADLSGREEADLLAATAVAARDIEREVLAFSFRKAAAALMDLARAANRYFDAAKPWEARTKDPARCARAIRACAEVVRSLAVLAAPFLPESAQRTWAMLGLPGKAADVAWSKAAAPGLPPGTLTIGKVETLFQKIPDETIAEEIAKLNARTAESSAGVKTATSGSPAPAAAAVAPAAALKPPISYDEFAKLDIRIGTIKAAEKHPKADRLLRLDVDIGLETRQIVAGIAGTYDPASLVGRRVVVLANLAPKEIRGLESRGMLLAADEAGKPFLLLPEGSPSDGTVVK